MQTSDSEDVEWRRADRDEERNKETSDKVKTLSVCAMSCEERREKEREECPQTQDVTDVSR